jgi:hypothetical protein
MGGHGIDAIKRGRLDSISVGNLGLQPAAVFRGIETRTIVLDLAAMGRETARAQDTTPAAPQAADQGAHSISSRLLSELVKKR